MTTQAELTGATSTQVQAAREALVAYLEALYPTLSLRADALADLILGAASDALAAVEYRATAAKASLDPETALAEGGYDTVLLDTVLAGRGVTRGAAAKASGMAVVVFSTSTQKMIATGTQFQTADGVIFAVSSSTRLLPPTATTSFSGDVILTQDPSGNFYGIVTVTAVETGENGNRPAMTSLSAVSTITDLVSAFLGSDTTGGADEESDADLLARLPAATAPRTSGSFNGAQGVVQDAVPTFSDVVLVGFGDDGMRRGRSVLTSQTPGRVDARVRTAGQPDRSRVTVTATLINATAPGTWRYSIAVDDAPGWFLVDKTLQTNDLLTDAGYANLSFTPGYDLTGVTDPPDIRSAADAFFSTYATAIVTFRDADTSTSGLTVNVSTKEYDSVLRVISGVDTAQTAVDASDVRATGGDCLVRSACPVMVSVTADATIRSGVELTDDEVSEAVAAAINASVIDNRISSSVVAAAALALLPAGTALQLSSWSGTVYDVTGSTSSVSGSTGLTVTTDWSLGLGTDTVAFYCDPEDITSTVT